MAAGSEGQTEKAVHNVGLRLTARHVKDARALAFSDDRDLAYVLKRAIEEGLPVLRANGVAPKRGQAKK